MEDVQPYGLWDACGDVHHDLGRLLQDSRGRARWDCGSVRPRRGRRPLRTGLDRRHTTNRPKNTRHPSPRRRPQIHSLERVNQTGEGPDRGPGRTRPRGGL